MVDEVVVKLDKGLKQTIKRLNRFDKDALFELLDKILDRQGILVAAHISKTMLSGQRLNRRTGALAQAMAGMSTRHQGFPALAVGVFKGPALKYAGIQEHGGTITPKKAKNLAIPPKGSPVLTPAGVDRYGSPRNYPGSLTYIPFKQSSRVTGALYDTGELKGIDNLRAITPAYLLVRSVMIKPKHYIRDGVMERLPAIAEALAKGLAGALVERIKSR